MQYESAQDLLLIEKKRALEYEKLLQSFPNAPASTVAFYLSRLNSFEKSLDENLKGLEERGWKGQLERQVTLNSKRKEMASRLDARCVESIDRHLVGSRIVGSIEEYRIVEGLYKASVENCSNGGRK